MSTYSETFREIRSPGRVAQVPRASLTPGRGLLHGAGVIAPLALGAASGQLVYGSFAALGALPTGVAAMVGHTEGRKSIATALLAAAGMAVASFAGALAAANPVYLVPVIALSVYVAGIVGAFSDRVAAAALQWPVALLMATVLPETPGRAAVRAGFVLLGGLFQAALAFTIAAPADHRSVTRTWSRPRRTPRVFAQHLFDTIRAHVGVGTVHGQHALRLATAAIVAELAARAVGLPHGYWAALTAVVVLKSDHVLTVRRGLDRVGGTTLGVVLGMLLAALAGVGAGPLLVGAGVVVVLAYTVFGANYFLFSAFITGFVVLLLDLLGQSARDMAGVRLEATLLGGAIALAASHVRTSDG
ncbi:MAG TPA: FUSC family protein [Actinocrinis sp.]|nr:FUSC family protein [Actinocrinis sp.]